MNIKKQNQKQQEQLCKNIKALRERNNLSIKELSKLSGVSEYMIENFENGIATKGANISHVFKLCHFFKIKLHKNFSQYF